MKPETEAQTKPEPTTVTYYDWHHVIKYIERKYNCCTLDYNGIGKGTEAECTYWSAPQNFQKYVNQNYNIGDRLFCISNDYSSAPNWVKEVLDIIFNEFLTDEDGFITFRV